MRDVHADVFALECQEQACLEFQMDSSVIARRSEKGQSIEGLDPCVEHCIVSNAVQIYCKQA